MTVLHSDPSTNRIQSNSPYCSKQQGKQFQEGRHASRYEFDNSLSALTTTSVAMNPVAMNPQDHTQLPILVTLMSHPCLQDANEFNQSNRIPSVSGESDYSTPASSQSNNSSYENSQSYHVHHRPQSVFYGRGLSYNDEETSIRKHNNYRHRFHHPNLLTKQANADENVIHPTGRVNDLHVTSRSHGVDQISTLSAHSDAASPLRDHEERDFHQARRGSSPATQKQGQRNRRLSAGQNSQQNVRLDVHQRQPNNGPRVIGGSSACERTFCVTSSKTDQTKEDTKPNKKKSRCRTSWRRKLWRFFCLTSEEMGQHHTKHASSTGAASSSHGVSTNRSNAATSPLPEIGGTSSFRSLPNSKRASSMRGLHASNSGKLPQNLEGLVFIENLRTYIDEKPTRIDEESSAVLKYRTPHFRASASVRIPAIPSNETWQIGWIQACTDMVFMNTYGPYGVSSWEFPELKSGGYVMISDSDGRNYPWYGSRTEVVTLVGPTKSQQTVQVSMNDNFYPHITWSVPLRNHREPALSHVRRDQGFYTWLVAKNADNDEIYILKTIRWSMHLEITVDPRKPLGDRARLVGSGIQNQPEILNFNIEIPRCALDPPNANSAQTLIWYPTVGKPQVVVPPKWKPTDRKKEE